MKKTGIFLLISAFCSLTVQVSVFATPSTQIWNPSSDIQGLKTFHLGIDNYFSVIDNKTKPVNVPTDVNLTYGLVKNLEVGFDYFGASVDPLQFNAKYGLSEGDKMPAVAVGGMNFGTKTDSTDFNIMYVVVAKTFKPFARLSLGYYSGNDKLLVDETGAVANTGAIVSLDKQINDKWWASVDYASGRSWYGVLSYGVSYAFAPNTSVIFGYVVPNNPNAIGGYVNNMVTTQLDINF